MSDGEGFGFNYASAAVTLLPPQLDDDAELLGLVSLFCRRQKKGTSDCDDLSAFADG